jgi:hypothetical protein
MYLHLFDIPNLLSGALPDCEGAGERTWRHSQHICALSDNDRHLGHIVKTRDWHAYDATRRDETSGGFKYLGEFGDVATAMLAVEDAVARFHTYRTMHAGSAGFSQPS